VAACGTMPMRCSAGVTARPCSITLKHSLTIDYLILNFSSIYRKVTMCAVWKVRLWQGPKP